MRVPLALLRLMSKADRAAALAAILTGKVPVEERCIAVALSGGTWTRASLVQQPRKRTPRNSVRQTNV